MSYHNNIAFTELTPDDIAEHEDLYIRLVVNNGCASLFCHLSLTQQSKYLDRKYLDIYHEYAIKETLKAKQLFQETFG